MDAAILQDPDCEIRLYDLSLVKTSIFFWELPVFRTEIRVFFSNYGEDAWKLETWHNQMTRNVLNLATTSIVLPPQLQRELKDAIISTGMKMYNWIMYVVWDLDLDLHYARQLFWTPLGFVDEEKIFKSIWVKDSSLYEGSPDKPIFRVACLLAQEDFVNEHQREMIEELKKLPMGANFKTNGLEVVNFPDKVYGIISTYLCYHIVRKSYEGSDPTHSVENLPQGVKTDSIRHPGYFSVEVGNPGRGIQNADVRIFQEFQRSSVLRCDIDATVEYGRILPANAMVLISVWTGSFHLVKYYYNSLESNQKDCLSSFLTQFKYPYFFMNHKVWKIREISSIFLDGILYECNTKWEHVFHPKFEKLLYCPMKGVVWPMISDWISSVERDITDLQDFVSLIIWYMEFDYSSGKIVRDRFLKLVKRVWIEYSYRHMQIAKGSLVGILYLFCEECADFALLKTILDEVDYSPIILRGIISEELQGLCLRDPNKMVLIYKSLRNHFFDSSADRKDFFIEQFCGNELLRGGKFHVWEDVYLTINVAPAPLRKYLDPVKCLRSVADLHKSVQFYERIDIKNCEKFIKWWHKSEKNQKNLKEKFAKSSYPSEIICKYWGLSFKAVGNPPERTSLYLLKWLFDSDDAILQFKREKLSILEVLDASFNEAYYLGYSEIYINSVHTVINEFISFCEFDEKRISIAKDEIRDKMEELIFNHANGRTILALNGLLDWVSMSEEERKKILGKLFDSWRIIYLCMDVLNFSRLKVCADIFYNKWVKYCGNISKLKSDLISKYKGKRNEKFILKLSSMYEKLERGEYLRYEDMLFEYIQSNLFY